MSCRFTASGASAGHRIAWENSSPPLMQSRGVTPGTGGEVNTAKSSPRTRTVRRARRGAPADPRRNAMNRSRAERGVSVTTKSPRPHGVGDAACHDELAQLVAEPGAGVEHDLPAAHPLGIGHRV